MNFRRIEDVVNFLRESDWNSVYQHDNALEEALTPESIDDVFEMITKNTNLPLIYESGGGGVTTAQICRYLSEKGIENYKLVAHDVNESLVEFARNRFSQDNRIVIELRSGSDYSNIPDKSVDGIFSLNTMIPLLSMYYIKKGDYSQHEDYLKETSRVLKEGKPLVLTHLWVPFVLVKDSKIKRNIPFKVKLYDEHVNIKPFLKLLEFVKSINNLDYLEELLNEGYIIKGPRKDSSRDLISFKAFLKRGKEFAPEDWLSGRGYKFVEPSTFTKGHRILYKIINGFPDERFNSNYSLFKEERETPLYLKVEVPKQKDI